MKKSKIATSMKIKKWIVKKLCGDACAEYYCGPIGTIITPFKNETFGLVPFSISSDIVRRDMSVGEYLCARDKFIQHAKVEILKAADKFFEVKEDLESGIVKVSLSIYAKDYKTTVL